MSDTMQGLDEELSRANRNLLLANAGLAVVALAVAAWFWAGLYSHLKPPFKVDADSLAQALQAPVQSYWNATGSEFRETGFFQEAVTRRAGVEISRKVSAEFRLLRLGRQWLLVKTLPTAQGLSVVGDRVPMPSRLAAELRAYEAAGVLVPGVMVDATATPYRWYGLAAGLALALALAGFNLLRWKARDEDPEQHPFVQGLQSLAPGLVPEVRRELASAGQDLGKIKLGNRWLFWRTFFGLKALRLADLCWCYPKVVTTKAYGFVTTGKEHSLVLHDRDGRVHEIEKTKAVAEELMQRLAARAPWVVLGHSDALAESWRGRRDEFIAEVERRKASARI
jgi:hypothetical protein